MSLIGCGAAWDLTEIFIAALSFGSGPAFLDCRAGAEVVAFGHVETVRASAAAIGRGAVPITKFAIDCKRKHYVRYTDASENSNEITTKLIRGRNRVVEHVYLAYYLLFHSLEIQFFCKARQSRGPDEFGWWSTTDY